MAITGMTMDVNSRMGKFGVSMGDSDLKIKRIDDTRKGDDIVVAGQSRYGVAGRKTTRTSTCKPLIKRATSP